VCNPESWLPSPEELEVRAKRRSSKSAAPPADLSPEDESLLEALRAWRLKAARGKPAYTVANNRTLETIAALRPLDKGSLAEIHGVGPTFMKRHCDDVLVLVADRS
jgi:superfamily II DNA helicase RecQ